MKHALAFSLLMVCGAIVACGDSGGDDGGTSITGDKFGCSRDGGCFETEIPEGGDKAAGEQVCRDYGGTVSAACTGTKQGCCDTSADILQCWYGELSADDLETSCESADGTWNPA